MTSNELVERSDCRKIFRSAYENRYTWPSSFIGYKGNCQFKNDILNVKGSFVLDKYFKPIVSGILDEEIQKSISAQLLEVSIHRIYRSFEQIHANNIFVLGETNEIGTQVIVEGKSKGDKYRIKDNIITMVHRHIHGNVIQIYTNEILQTPAGYLSKSYSSQYFHSNTFEPKTAKSYFVDKYQRLDDGETYLLYEREIKTDPFLHNPSLIQTFIFSDLTMLD